MDWNGLVTKRLAGVAPEVNLRIPLHAHDEANVTRSPKHWFQGYHHITRAFQKVTEKVNAPPSCQKMFGGHLLFFVVPLIDLIFFDSLR